MNARAPLYQARYGSAATPTPTAGSPVIDHLLAHRSVRAYLPDPVSDDTLSAIVAAAQSAASSSNLHAWSVVAVRDPGPQGPPRRTGRRPGAHPPGPPLLVWLADLARLDDVATRVGESSAALDYLEMFEVGVIDAALAAQNAVTAAESLGLGTVYIGAMRNRPEDVAAELQLPPRVVAVFGLCVGTPDPQQPAAVKPRPPQSVVLHQETYSLPAQQPGLAEYDSAMSAFYASQGMKVRGTWSHHSAKRIRDAAALSGLAASTAASAAYSQLYVFGGGNNVRDIALQVLAGADPAATIAAGAADYLDDVVTMLGQLQAEGARRFVVWNTPNLGLTPFGRSLGVAGSGLLTGISAALGGTLFNGLAGIDGVSLFDVYGLITDVAAHPANYGLSNVDDACIAGACDVDTQLFWDGLHPTAAAHEIIANAMLRTVPEPASALLALWGLSALALWRRRA
jgi:nitroreductase